jgi:DNA-binding transcriptional ArsR family regulator
MEIVAAKKRGSRSVKRLTDPKALRALAHPVRLELVGLLRRQGPLTATKAAELLGESSGTTSFHLRQLAKYGLVEEAGGGQRRERPWRATAMFTGWPEVADSSEVAEASGLLRAVIAERYFEQLMRWLETRDSEPMEWQEAAHFGDTLLWVTAEELRALGEEELALIERYLERQTRPELRPHDARLVTHLHLAFPTEAGGRRESGRGRRD